MEERAKIIADLLKLLANENRLLILCALIKGPMSVGKIAEFIPNITSSALSQHLNLLRRAGILGSNKSAQTVTYFIVDIKVTEVISTLKKYYCKDEDFEDVK